MRVGRLPAALATAALALTLAACGGGDDAADVANDPKFDAGTTMARLSSAGTVNVGTKFDQPLFGLKGLDGKPEGFDVEIAKIIAGELGIPADKINYIETPSKVREEVLEQGRVDFVVATYTINDKRKERIMFAGPYYEAGQDLMVKKGNPKDIDGPESLRGKGVKVCSVTGSTPSEKIKEFVDGGNIVLFDVYSKCADALRTGQVDAVTTDNVILLGLVDANKDDFELVEKPFTKEPYGIGVKKGDTAFCTFINEVLKKAADDDSYADAWKDTAGKVAEETPELPSSQNCS